MKTPRIACHDPGRLFVTSLLSVCRTYVTAYERMLQERRVVRRFRRIMATPIMANGIIAAAGADGHMAPLPQSPGS